MVSFNGIVIGVVLLTLCSSGYIEGFIHSRERRASDDEILGAIGYEAPYIFDSVVNTKATERRKIACFFVYDQAASSLLNNNVEHAMKHATKLAELASRYTAHANIVVTNAGVEMWSAGDQIAFTATSTQTAMPEYLSQFQDYLRRTKKDLFGSKYAVGVLMSNRSTVRGGYSQGPPCDVAGAALINFRQYPWSIGGLLAHELAHVLGVVHPAELQNACIIEPTLSFCNNNALMDQCKCTISTAQYPYVAQDSQCLMTFAFGSARTQAAKFTACDIEMMNKFSSKISCLAPVK